MGVRIVAKCAVVLSWMSTIAVRVMVRYTGVTLIAAVSLKRKNKLTITVVRNGN
jgi:hypothetical protein